MKKLVLVLGFILTTSFAYAVDITITLTDEQFKAMQVLTVTPQEWIQHAAENKANKMIDRISNEVSDKKVDRMTKAEKKAIIDALDVTKERKKRLGR